MMQINVVKQLMKAIILLSIYIDMAMVQGALTFCVGCNNQDAFLAAHCKDCQSCLA